MTRDDLMWAVGFLEGEGSFSTIGRGASVSAPQVELWPLQKLQQIFGGKLYVKRQSEGSARLCNIWVEHGARAVGIMMTLWSFLSPKRQAQVETALKRWRAIKPHPRFSKLCPAGHV